MERAPTSSTESIESTATVLGGAGKSVGKTAAGGCSFFLASLVGHFSFFFGCRVERGWQAQGRMSQPESLIELSTKFIFLCVAKNNLNVMIFKQLDNFCLYPTTRWSPELHVAKHCHSLCPHAQHLMPFVLRRFWHGLTSLPLPYSATGLWAKSFQKPLLEQLVRLYHRFKKALVSKRRLYFGWMQVYGGAVVDVLSDFDLVGVRKKSSSWDRHRQQMSLVGLIFFDHHRHQLVALSVKPSTPIRLLKHFILKSGVNHQPQFAPLPAHSCLPAQVCYCSYRSQSPVRPQTTQRSFNPDLDTKTLLINRMQVGWLDREYHDEQLVGHIVAKRTTFLDFYLIDLHWNLLFTGTLC